MLLRKRHFVIPDLLRNPVLFSPVARLSRTKILFFGAWATGEFLLPFYPPLWWGDNPSLYLAPQPALSSAEGFHGGFSFPQRSNLKLKFLTLLLDFYSCYAIITNAIRKTLTPNRKDLQGEDRKFCIATEGTENAEKDNNKS